MAEIWQKIKNEIGRLIIKPGGGGEGGRGRERDRQGKVGSLTETEVFLIGRCLKTSLERTQVMENKSNATDAITMLQCESHF